MSPETILSATNVTKSFGGLLALDHTDLNVGAGELALLIGPNGSGKTTLINVITGVYRPDTGHVFFNGNEITGLTPHEIYRAGLVRTFQIPQPFRKLSVLENLLVADRTSLGEGIVTAVMTKRWAKNEEEAVDRAFRVLELIRLDSVWDREAYKLSGGQLKLLEAGRALMSGARMVLMDEPAAGVNPALAHEVFQYLKELNRSAQLSFLLIEHRLELALPYVDKVYVMLGGKIIAEGRPDEILSSVQVAEAYLAV